MTTSLRTLILEDLDADVELIVRELRRTGFDPDYRRVQGEADYTAELSPDLDLILADYSLPQFDALRALRILQSRHLDVPFIVVTGAASEEAPVACMKNGATDYLLKDRLARLGPAIVQALAARRERAAKQQADEQIFRRNQERALFRALVAASATSVDEQAFLQHACDELAGAVDATLTFAALVNDARTGAVVVAETGAVRDLSFLGHVFLFSANAMGQLLSHLTRPLPVNRLAEQHDLAGFHARLLSHGISSLALLPLPVEGRPVGILGFAATLPDHFGQEKMTLLSGVAAELSRALLRIRLEREHLRQSAAIEQISDAIIFMDIDGIVQYVNLSFERMSGYARNDVIGHSACSVMGFADDGFCRVMRETACAEGTWRGRTQNRGRKGSSYTAELSLSPVRDRSGRVMSFVGILRDITEELLKEERLMQAQKMEAVGRLAGGVAHDFNNILTTITGYADLLSARLPSGGPEQADLDFIEGAAQRAAALTKQLLAFSRKQVLQPQVLNVNAILDEVKVMLKPLIRDDVELCIVPDPRLGNVRADPVQLVQVIMNLAVNARDAMPRGGVLTLTTANAEVDEELAGAHPGLRPGSYVLLSVSDTGIGISPDALPHVFEPFFTTKTDGRGTGLGLATVYGIVKQSGGHIALWSEPGTGTRFDIRLPRSFEEHTVEPPSREQRVFTPGTEAILFAEDDDGVRRMIVTVLESRGYAVTAAARPEEALAEVAAGRRFDLLVTDIVIAGHGREGARGARPSHPAGDQGALHFRLRRQCLRQRREPPAVHGLSAEALFHQCPRQGGAVDTRPLASGGVLPAPHGRRGPPGDADRHHNSLRPNETAAAATIATANSNAVATGQPASKTLPDATVAGPPTSAAGEYMPSGFHSPAIETRTYVPSPMPAAPACELTRTERSVITAMKKNPKASHAPVAANRGPAGAAPNSSAVPPHVMSVPAATVMARKSACTSVFATMKAVRDTGFVRTRAAVPLLRSEETMPP